jgi:hypothetical protein
LTQEDEEEGRVEDDGAELRGTRQVLHEGSEKKQTEHRPFSEEFMYLGTQKRMGTGELL